MWDMTEGEDSALSKNDNGIFDNIHVDIICDECDGSGLMSDDQYPEICPNCKGRGKVSIPYTHYYDGKPRNQT